MGIADLDGHGGHLKTRFVLAVWLAVVVAVSLTPLSFKVKIHTSGPYHAFLHYCAYGITAVLLWMVARRPSGRAGGFLFGLLLAVGQEWVENKVFHAGFEWKDVAADFAGLVSGFALMVLIATLQPDGKIPKARY